MAALRCLTQRLLTAAFGLGGWFGVTPLWGRLGSEPVLAVRVWLLPLLALALLVATLIAPWGEMITWLLIRCHLPAG